MILAFWRAFFASRAALTAENLALRHQLAVLQRSAKRPKLRTSDRKAYLGGLHHRHTRAICEQPDFIEGGWIGVGDEEHSAPRPTIQSSSPLHLAKSRRQSDSEMISAPMASSQY